MKLYNYLLHNYHHVISFYYCCFEYNFLVEKNYSSILNVILDSFCIKYVIPFLLVRWIIRVMAASNQGPNGLQFHSIILMFIAIVGQFLDETIFLIFRIVLDNSLIFGIYQSNWNTRLFYDGCCYLQWITDIVVEPNHYRPLNGNVVKIVCYLETNVKEF